MAAITDRTVGGLLAYCDWLKAKNYQSANGVEAWKVAVNKVFSTVEGDAFESLDLTNIDLDEYVERFRVGADAQYKAETIGVYRRRIKNAMGAQAEYAATGRQAMLTRAARKGGGGSEPKTPAGRVDLKSAAAPTADAVESPVGGELVQFPFPLGSGQMAQLKIPPRLRKEDVDRLSAFLRTLQYEEQKQLSTTSGGQFIAA